MTINVAELKKRLQEKERDLLAAMAEHEENARDSLEPEVRDHMDQVVSSAGAEQQFRQASAAWHMLEQVREALDRIQKGTYGICIDCGRRIEPQRLEAIPWTPYCSDDQNRHDRGPKGELPAEPTL